MRISDWSSDVCSSDLIAEIATGAEVFAAGEHECTQRFVVLQFGERLRERGRQGLTQGVALARLIEGHDGHAIAALDKYKVAHAFSGRFRSEEHTCELQSLMRTSYDVICLTKKKHNS